MWFWEAASSSSSNMRTAISILFLAGCAAAESYSIRPDPGAHFRLEVFKTGLMAGKKHVFLFQRYDGMISYDAAQPENSKVELTIEAASIVCMDEWIGAGNKRKVEEYALKDMMDAATHPQLRFTSSAVTKRPDGKFDVQGALTIRSFTRPVTVLVSILPDTNRARFSGKAEVRLKDYGLKPRSAVLVIGTKSEMSVDFSLIAIPR